MIRAVLDTTAVALYAQGGNPAIPIGELIGEIVDENAHFGVPALCLAAAVSELGAKSGLLDVLASPRSSHEAPGFSRGEERECSTRCTDSRHRGYDLSG